jgi:delta-aminolevulinic acid dehydratase/porphobilinogen synthase
VGTRSVSVVSRANIDDHAAANDGWIDGDKAMVESLTALKRAGADGVLTYFAPRGAEKLLKAKQPT